MRLEVVSAVLFAMVCAGHSGAVAPGADVLLRETAVPATAMPAFGQVSGEGSFERALLDSFGAPGTKPMGIDWVETGQVIYHVDEAQGDVYSISPEGTASYLFRASAMAGYPMAEDMGNGICHVETRRGEYLYVTDYNGHTQDPNIDRVYKFELDGTFVGSWDVATVADSVVGICFDGASFWLSSYGRREIVRCDTSFQETAAFPHPAATAGGMDYDPETGLFYVADFVLGAVYVCDSEMNVIGLFPGHPLAINMVGISVGRATRGRSAWTSTFGSTAPPIDPSIFEIEDVYYNETTVEAMTWSSIKAMYR